ncbi:MAG: YheT family hydrolase, partial [Candidatus Acidiferrum sp.]
SSDVAAVAEELLRKDGLPSLALAGYSMGGNLVLKCAGEWGSAPPPQVKAVCGISPAMDLGPSADALHDFSNRIYELKFLWGLRRRFARKVELFPQRFHPVPIGLWESLRVFDDKVTARFSGFKGADDYYNRASSARVLEHISVPTLVIHAKDDPFIRVMQETRAKLAANPYIQFIETERGGHCAFLAPPNGYDGRWAERKIIEFVQSAELG